MFGVEELDRHAQQPDLNYTEKLWDKLDCQLQARSSCPILVAGLTNLALSEWAQILKQIQILLKLVESSVEWRQF